MRKRSILSACLAVSLLPLGLSLGAQTLTVHVDQPVHKVSPTLYGLMTEEINFSYDGGLYPELIRDRTLGHDWQALAHWTLVNHGNSVVKISPDDKNGVSTALPRSLKVQVDAASATAKAGVQNDGFWGVPVTPNTTYVGSFYAKSDKPGTPIQIAIVNDDTGAVAATATVESVSGEWKRYSYLLKTGNVAVSSNNHFQLLLDRPATVWFNLVSLFPPTYKDRPYGFRKDLMELQAAMRPTFLRMPGGNYLEGNKLSERFDWKKTIGPWTERPTHQSPWNYRSSDGMGLLEFLQWCEDLKIEPVLAVFAGYTLDHRHVEVGAAMEPYVQDALDEIEYVSGDVNTKWGAVRAQNGHPAPFPLHYVEIGNEDFFDKSGSYEGRYTQFYKAIKAKYPQLQLIATTPVKSMKPDMIDDHFYMAAEKSFEDANHYDKVDRNGPKIFVGEWATREGSPTPNLQAALGDAAWMTGMERNSDLVLLSAYAPLFVNVNPGGMQWETDLIGYNALTAYPSPSYWAQVLFAQYLGTEVVKTDLQNAGPHFFTSVTRDEAKHKLYLKVVNASSEVASATINLDGVAKVVGKAKLSTLSGKTPNATNTIDRPNTVAPVNSTVELTGNKLSYNFVPYSITAIEIGY